MTSTQQRPLVILDLNGVLCHMHYHEHGSGGSGNYNGIPPDFVERRKGIYVRPFLHTFLDDLFASYDVACWTSNSEAYALPIAKRLFGPRYFERLEFLWTQRECDRETTNDAAKWTRGDTLRKNLDRVLSHPPSRVVLVDDTSEKLKATKGQGLVALTTFLPTRQSAIDDSLLQLRQRIDEHFSCALSTTPG